MKKIHRTEKKKKQQTRKYMGCVFGNIAANKTN